MMKDKLVGTRFGAGAMHVRDWFRLRSIPLRNPEQAMATGNGIIADRLIGQVCRPGTTFLDIGAHIGSVFSEVHRHDPSIRIQAIEADPAKAMALRAKFPYCHVRNLAVGEQCGEVSFYIDRERSGYSSLVKRTGTSVETVKVSLQRLDDLFPDAMIETIKIDIEGAELGALRGGSNLLQRCRPTIMFESTGLGMNSLGYSPTMLWEWLNNADFHIMTPDRVAHDAPPLGLETFLDAHQYPVRSQNFFAVASEKISEIRTKAREILHIHATK